VPTGYYDGMSERRTEIPEAIKREVRQRCGFGCVICGIPIYEYDHIVPHSAVGLHETENLTLLCPTHHAEKTRHLLPEAMVRLHNSSPRNLVGGQTAPHPFHYASNNASIEIGGNSVILQNATASALKIDDLEIVGFELVDESLLLNLEIRGADGLPILKVVRSEMIHSTHAWDYKFSGRRLTIRRGPRDVLCQIVFDTIQNRVVFEGGSFSHNGIDLLVSQHAMCILNNRMLLSGNAFAGTSTAIQIGEPAVGRTSVAIGVKIDRAPYDRHSARLWARREMRKNLS